VARFIRKGKSRSTTFTCRLEAYKITLKDGCSIIIPVDSDFFRNLTSGALVPAVEE
jgi:hypothetical protein